MFPRLRGALGVLGGSPVRVLPGYNERMPKLALLITVLFPSLAAADGWATIRGRFVVVGEPSPPAKVKVEKDPYCERCKPVDERILVGKSGGLENVVVYIRAPRGERLAIRPDATGGGASPVSLENKRCRFTPRIALVQTGQPLVIRNADPTAHNTKIDLVRNEGVNSVLAAKGEMTVRLEAAESLPMPVSCSIHPFMRGYVLVRDDPHMAVSGEDGRLELPAIPAGEHRLQLWHETGYLAHAETAAGTADRRGRLAISAPAGGVVDLGDVRIDAASLVR